jgi:hypothetical protein
MNRAQIRPRTAGPSDNVVELLTTQQYLRPHQPLREVLRMAMDHLGCCPRAIERALEWLGVDASHPVGRLRRSELIQLGKSISRFWQRAAQTDDVQNSR